jgi:hypothetical protein
MDQPRQEPTPKPRSLRQHLSELKSVQQDSRGKRTVVAPNEDLLAEVSQEASDIEYERWDGLS